MKLSIIIPTLNEEKVLEGTLKSLRRNLSIPHEIIVSDGGSKDATAEIARAHADKVLVYSGTARQTIAMGRNDGAKAASPDSELLVFWDADCSVPDPQDFFSRATALFEKDAELSAITGTMRVLPEHATIWDTIIFGAVNAIFRFENNVLGRGDAAGEFQMMRRSAFDAVGGYREDLVAREDGDMFRRISEKGGTYLAPSLVVFHTGRRAHKIGWPRLLCEWFLNTISVMFRNKSHSKEWKPIR